MKTNLTLSLRKFLSHNQPANLARLFVSVLFTLIILVYIGLGSGVEAFRFNPERGSYGTGYKNFNIIASPPEDGANAVRVHIKSSSNARINYYTPPRGNGWLTPIGECAQQKRYTDNELCFSIAKTSDIIAGESLGVISVQFLSAGDAILDIQTSSFYTNGTSEVSVSNNSGSYSVDPNLQNTNELVPTTAPAPAPSITLAPTNTPTPTPTVTEVVEDTVTPTPESTPTVVPNTSQNVVPTASGVNNNISNSNQNSDGSDTATSLLILFVGGLVLISALFGLALLLIRRGRQDDFGPTYQEIQVNAGDDPYSITI